MSQFYFRRCHLCGELNQNSTGRVERCGHCAVSLAPFYYFDERKLAIFSSENARPGRVETEYQPIVGLTVYWDAS